MEKRIKNLQETLKGNQAALILGDINRLYFTGFKSSAGALLVTSRKALFLIDFRYFERAKKEIKHIEVNLSEKLFSQIKEFLLQEKIDEILIETDFLTLDEFKRYKEHLSLSDSSCLTKHILEMRSIKTKEEIDFIQKAQEMTDKAFCYILDYIKAGVTEKEIALKLEFFMRSLGSEGVAFDSIVVSGKNSSLPHGVPTDKKIEKGDFVTMDFGAVYRGYRSDMTRTVAVGRVSEEQRKVYNTVLLAQNAAFKSIKANVACRKVDKAARDLINNAGFEGCFGHGLGHSVGLEIHEAPACNTRDETLLKTDMIMTVEPGIYLENRFGVRIEDMVAVTENGYINLTNSPKELIIL